MAAGGRDLERAPGVRLSADVGEVEIVGRRGRGRRCCGGGVAGLAVQEADRPAQVGRRQHAEPGHRARLRRILDGHDERADAPLPAREADGQGAPHGSDLAVERQLADDRDRADAPVADGARGGENAERDRQVERRALLPEIGRREIDRDPVRRKREARVADGRAHALAALAHGRVGEPHRREGRQARRDVHFDADERRLHTDQGRREHARQHGAIVRSSARAVNVASWIQYVEMQGVRSGRAREVTRDAGT